LEPIIFASELAAEHHIFSDSVTLTPTQFVLRHVIFWCSTTIHLNIQIDDTLQACSGVTQVAVGERVQSSTLLGWL
jgi:hypothetical protein